MCGLLWRTSYQKIKNIAEKIIILRPKNDQSSTITRVYRLFIHIFQRSVLIGFVLLPSIPSTMQNLKKFYQKVFEEMAWQPNKQTRVKLKVLSNFIRDQKIDLGLKNTSKCNIGGFEWVNAKNIQNVTQLPIYWQNTQCVSISV